MRQARVFWAWFSIGRPVVTVLATVRVARANSFARGVSGGQARPKEHRQTEFGGATRRECYPQLNQAVFCVWCTILSSVLCM
jgi:hypothetical protein